MNHEAIIKELSLIDAQEEALIKRRRKYLQLLSESGTAETKPASLSSEQIAEALNKREVTILKRIRNY